MNISQVWPFKATTCDFYRDTVSLKFRTPLFIFVPCLFKAYFALTRGENGPGCWALRPVDGNPNRCLFEWLLDTDLKVTLLFLSQGIIFDEWCKFFVVEYSISNFLMALLWFVRWKKWKWMACLDLKVVPVWFLFTFPFCAGMETERLKYSIFCAGMDTERLKYSLSAQGWILILKG